MFMKSGRASNWAQWMFELDAEEGMPFADWLDFEMEFQKPFTLLNSNVLAINKLEGTTYYQWNHSVDDYVDKFEVFTLPH